MRTYETTFIINPQTDDATIDRQVKAVAEVITSNGGKILHEDRLGTRRLAYQIQGLAQGYYTNLVFDAPVEALPKIERHYQLEEAYVRFLTVVYEGCDPSELAEQQAASEVMVRKPFRRYAGGSGGGRRDRGPAAPGTRPAPGRAGDDKPAPEKTETDKAAVEDAKQAPKDVSDPLPTKPEPSTEAAVTPAAEPPVVADKVVDEAPPADKPKGASEEDEL